jgi:hypothetical protein
MERTKKPTINSDQKLHALASALVSRMQFAAKLGDQYNGDRNLYEALGYKITLEYRDYVSQYFRQDIAKAVIDRPVKATWRGKLKIQESKKEKETQFEKDWIELNKKLKIVSNFSRVDRLSGLGKYAVLLLGLDDVRTKEDYEKSVATGKRSLKYIKPFGEGCIDEIVYEKNINDERFGLPVLYRITVVEPKTLAETSFKVHHTRIIHVVEDILESEIEGIPGLQAIFNRLMDLEKIIGGDGEMFWRGARPGYHGKLDKEFQLTAAEEEKLMDQIDEYEHNLRRFLINEGIDIEALEQQISDPKPHVDVCISMISAAKGIPKRILIGSERGELSSAQDSDEYKEYVQTRREEHAEVHIIQPFIDACIKYQILAKPVTGEYAIVWSDLFTKSEKEKTEIGKNRATALREYMTSPFATSVVPPPAFMEYFLGLPDEDIELIMKMAEGVINSEEGSMSAITQEQMALVEQELKQKQTNPVRTKNAE